MYNPNSNMPLLSVILTTYNRKDMLKKAIDSVLEQDYENIELIISDNASEDGTDIMVQEYLKNNKNIIYIRRDINIGSENGYKAYDDYANGKYIFFLCDDDYLMGTTFFSHAVDILEKHENIIIVSGHVCMYIEGMNKYLNQPYCKENFINGIDYFINQSSTTLGGKYQEIVSLFLLMRKKDLDNNIAFKKYKYSGDVAIKTYAESMGDIYILNEYIGCYYINLGTNSDSSDKDRLEKEIYDTFDFIDLLIDRYTSLYPKYKKFWNDYIPIFIFDWHIRYRLLRSFNLYDSKNHKKNLKELKIFLKKSCIKEKNKKGYKFLMNVFFPKHQFHFLLFEFSFYKIYFNLFSIRRFQHYFRITFFGINFTFKLKNNEYYHAPALYAYATRNINKNEKLDVYYKLEKESNSQLSSYLNINDFFASEDILKDAPITKLNSTDQTRPDQTRPDQTKINICNDYIYIYNNSKYKKLQPILQCEIAA